MTDLTKTYNRTYNRAARAKDAGSPGPPPKLSAQRAVQDTVLAERHHNFDLQAQDNTMKYERPHFAVVGEGTRTAIERYHIGWERIFGKGDNEY